MSEHSIQEEPERLSYSVAEAAKVTGLGRTTIYGLIGSGELPSRKIGNRRLIPAKALEALVSEFLPQIR